MTDKRVLCDVCGAPATPINHEFALENDGNGHNEWNSKTIDLCHVHTAVWLQKFLEEPPLAPAKTMKNQFCEWAKRQNWEPKP